ncbi:MAG: carboxypeptidase-like regulatory domain-containing protein [Chitinophagaceae bacterium]
MFLLINFFTITAFAQVKISGKVTGKEGNGLPGISVTVKNTNYGTSTDANGNYVLTAPVKQGNYQLEFSGVGFKTTESTVRISNAENYSVDAQLTDDALGLDEVVVTGTSQGTTRRQLGNYISNCKS